MPRNLTRNLAPREEPPAWMELRPRNIYRWLPEITPKILRVWRETGALKDRRWTPNSHPVYLVADIKEALGIPVVASDDRALGKDAPLPLLRLRGVKTRIGFPRDETEILVNAGLIKPFYKHENAKALYPTWQFKKFQLDDLKITPQPTKKLIRRRAVINWLSVPAAEIEPWVSLGIIHRCDGFYRTSEIRQRVLGLR